MLSNTANTNKKLSNNMRRRTSPRLKAKTLKHTLDCLSISTQTKQANRLTKPMEEKKLKATQKVTICLSEPWDHTKLKEALEESKALFPLPSDLELDCPLRELTQEERRDYLETLERRRDEMTANIRLKNSLRAMVQRYNNRIASCQF
ncbi:hypothetical protein FVEN_g2334 [Fusarium venenatum]|uniref:Uncharacterized protein n=1 Tax=Fusarium venenatum TaxID=56646 RepID=A0A2L2TEV0_9HYPO|nr:uncharacterized protein FVRRES_12773 [Fusarium venenatum]KAG8360295.1 hypothetical protein FVEN_g2334 [Fusarium venenatum]KAH6979358.1 hypothetical protein EDB82DRAFT_507650 [Fusarium venenatum]CEI40082.1 unnamed protein product [Fusarium venenatum]